MTVMIVLALAVVAVLAAIVVLAMGRGGELGHSHPDHTPLQLAGDRRLAGTDVVLLRLPLGLFGYHTEITNNALRRIAGELTDRDTQIAILEQRLAEAEERLVELDGSGVRPPRPRSGDDPVDAEPPGSAGPTNVRLTTAATTNPARPAGHAGDELVATGGRGSGEGRGSGDDRVADVADAPAGPARAGADGDWSADSGEEEAW